MVALGLGNPSASSGELTEPISIAHVIHDRHHCGSCRWTNQNRDDVIDNQSNCRIGRILGMIPYHPVHQNVRRDALKRTPESDSLSYIVNIENDQNHNEKHLFTENNFYCLFILEKWPLTGTSNLGHDKNSYICKTMMDFIWSTERFSQPLTHKSPSPPLFSF